MRIGRRELLAAGMAGTAASALPAFAQAGNGAREPVLAPTPPMGWNSWNSFATTITEAQARETARIMADKLLPFGYDVFTVDIQWYEPNAASYTYNAKPVPAMDGNGRLLPAPNRFPSSANGRGFAPLAAEVHALGLKFGVHLMRGIPRLAVERNLPVLGTKVRAADIADTSSTCSWNPDMYGVDMTRPGAQAYYDSVFRLFASWGVDFVKMDDMSRPYDAHALEIEAAHKAIAASGRPMILSLSPGETPVTRGEHVRRFAQMWRISDDFWDEWPLLEAQFTRLENWNPWRRPGGWPDADMLPLGRLALGERDTKFTPDEQRTLMTLWSIARSPLIMGGDLRHLDDPTLALLTNREVLAVNQASTDNQPHFLADGVRVWSARPADGRGRYVALFNTGKEAREITLPLREFGLSGSQQVRDLWEGKALAPAKDRLIRRIPSHGAGLYRVG
ncbi:MULTISPECIES: glycoside hydrolase family 27 protein [Sphingomonas]|uniref:glycoside hydrolase family 27 protein n=1 Tax=Sphingomonas TaxID=13687 RepID=UPI000F7F77BC|nr:glycoside hydrolase family 27 protein [Sphingomonas sp. ABOLF]RSV14726.1 glycoside hydrolase family 27 protein [Sphingomonas sp. ABOLF]GLK19341.1 alpha-galactosidase [Microbacterium terregens]